MCLEIPGKIIKIEGKKAIIDYGGVAREANILHGKFKVGDMVIVSNKIIVDKLSKEDNGN